MHAYDHERSPVRVPAGPVGTRSSPVPSPGRRTVRATRPSQGQLRALQGLGFDDGAAVQRLAANPGPVGANPGHADALAVSGGASTVVDVLRSPGRPLPVAVRQDMEARLGADFTDVRLHTDRAAQDSAAEIGARAYTSGRHVVIGAGGGDRHTLAHELSHVLQQRRGAVAGTDHGDGLKVSDPSDRFEREAEAVATSALRGGGPSPVSEPGAEAICVADSAPGGDVAVQRSKVFEPFVDGTPSGATLNNPTDVLLNRGLTYPDGGTRGNKVRLEEMLSNSGGGSNPGEPADITKMRLADVNLVRARGQQNAATAMHAINGDFTNGANGTPDNIFMGSARSNTREHYNKVERPIRAAMQNGTHGLVAAYEQMMRNDPPAPLGGTVVGWDAPGKFIPGASTSPADLAPHLGMYPNLTHVLDTDDPVFEPDGPWPKLIEYEVTPDYSYSPNPSQWPNFLQDNYNEADKLVKAELAKPVAQQDAAGLKNEQDAMQILLNHAHLLFPAEFRCEADYYIASYDPSALWYHSHDVDDYDAEA